MSDGPEAADYALHGDRTVLSDEGRQEANGLDQYTSTMTGASELEEEQDDGDTDHNEEDVDVQDEEDGGEEEAAAADVDTQKARWHRKQASVVQGGKRFDEGFC